MADDQDDSQKTEDPTEKRLAKAREEGNVPTSKEVYTWFILLMGSVIVFALFGSMANSFKVSYYRFIEQPHDVLLSSESFIVLFNDILLQILKTLAIPFVLLYIAAVLAGYVQNGWILSLKSVTPKLEKISPLAGVKRLFSMRSLVEFLKNLSKLAIITIIAYFLVAASMDKIYVMVGATSQTLLVELYEQIKSFILIVSVFLTIIAGGDLAYQKYSYIQRMKMTKQEVKDEAKESDGDPQIKAKLRQLRMEKFRKRMMQDVAQADVVITNPTHYAIALKYQMEDMEAPVLVAKGLDHLALRIRGVAEEHDIPIVENPPLARALYDGVEVDEEIPEQYYKAVAEVISYIYELKKKFF